jgi:tetratricopeptide (TPR) repeat protein
MGGDFEAPAQELNNGFRAAFVAGDFSAMRELLPAAADAMAHSGNRGVSLVRSIDELRAWVAYVALTVFHRESAADALRPYLAPQNPLQVATAAAFGSGPRRSFSAGLVLSQLGRLFYRFGDLKSAQSFTRRALEALTDVEGDSTAAWLLAALSNVWLARILWNLGLRGDVDAALEQTTRALMGAEAPASAEGGRGVVLANAFTIWAHFDWLRADIGKGREKSYKALYYSGASGAKNPVALAHALYVAARIEVSESPAHLSWPMQMLEKSEDLFRGVGHAFQWRVRVVRAQCHIDADEPNEANRLLDSVLDGERTSELHGQELARLEAELTRLWIREDEAAANPRLWRSCLSTCRNIRARFPKLPEALQSEADLHLGLAQLHTRDKRTGEELLEGITMRSGNRGIAKIVARAHLGLAQRRALAPATQAEAAAHFDKAFALLAQERSAYWRRLHDRIGSSMIENETLELDMNKSYAEAEREFLGKLYALHSRRTSVKSVIANRLKVSLRTMRKHQRVVDGTTLRGKKPGGARKPAR